MRREMFTDKDLRDLILLLFIGQFLLMFVGIADTFVVRFSIEADVSGVSLVTSFNTVLILLFTVLFGTYQIAANGAAQSIWSLASIMGLAMAPVYTTVIGQCMDTRDMDAANFYFRKLNKITPVLSILWNALIFAITPLIVRYSAISPEAKEPVIRLMRINNIFNALAYPFIGSLGNGLRAAGDVKFTRIVSISLTIGARLLFSALFGLWLGWGVIGVALGMSADLVFR